MKTANACENVNNVYNIDENLKLENLNLKEKLKDIQTKSALTVFENEELEIKNEALRKDVTKLDDELEEAYSEARNLKSELNRVNNENVKLKETTDSNLKEVLDRIKAEKEKQKNVVMELEANILMLVNVVESRNERIYTLEEEFKQMEETYSTSIIPNCESCENVADSQNFC